VPAKVFYDISKCSTFFYALKNLCRHFWCLCRHFLMPAVQVRGVVDVDGWGSGPAWSIGHALRRPSQNNNIVTKVNQSWERLHSPSQLIYSKIPCWSVRPIICQLMRAMHQHLITAKIHKQLKRSRQSGDQHASNILPQFRFNRHIHSSK
jgi:hypothetical protein